MWVVENIYLEIHQILYIKVIFSAVMRIAAYPGSFDPVTNGHIDVIKRSLKLFDKVIVLVGDNPQKQPAFTAEERVEMIKKALEGLRNVEVEAFEGLLLEHVKKKDCKVMIRGLRAISDFEFEFQRALMNRQLEPEIETIFIMTKDNHAFLNSSLVKEIAMFHGSVRDFVPEFVEKKLKEKFG